MRWVQVAVRVVTVGHLVAHGHCHRSLLHLLMEEELAQLIGARKLGKLTRRHVTKSEE